MIFTKTNNDKEKRLSCPNQLVKISSVLPLAEETYEVEL